MNKRTYCVYLVHFPAFQLLLTGFTLAGVQSPSKAAGLLLVFGFPLTAVAAEALHRFVELPGMRLGKEVARRLRAASKPDVVAHPWATRIT
jgi:peptidoglycan/LPS O-acetylase OafA/YrhL